MTELVPRVSERWPQVQGRDWLVVTGDALLYMPDLPNRCIDLVLTDPPYSSGGAYRGDRTKSTRDKYVNTERKGSYVDFEGDSRDQLGFLSWCSTWFAELWRVTRIGGFVCVFTDWRQLPVTMMSLQAGGFVLRGVAVWDKTEAVRPQLGRFRQQAEFIVWGTRGAHTGRPGDPCVDGVLRHQTLIRDRHHIAEKPVNLIREVVPLCPDGGLIFDPFAGTGTTGVAAIREGRRVILGEILEGNANLCVERIRAEERQLDLSMARAGQGSIFDSMES